MAEREGFEPSIRFRIHTFQACAFDHSAISPTIIYRDIVQQTTGADDTGEPYILQVRK